MAARCINPSQCLSAWRSNSIPITVKPLWKEQRVKSMRSRVVIGSAILVVGGLMSFPQHVSASDQSRAKEIIQQTCMQCHRLEGQADSRFNLKAPDLIWAGSKYQRSWLIRWLTGQEAPLYAKGYRWDLTEVP